MAGQDIGEHASVFPVERELTTPRAAGVAGIVFAGLFVAASIVLLRGAAGRSLSTQMVIANVHGPRLDGPAVASLYLTFFAAVAFLWFMAVLRDRIGRREDKFLATVFLGSGLLFVAMFLAGAAALGALAAGARFGTGAPVDAAVVGYARSLGYTFLLVFATKAAGVFTIVTATMLLRLAHWPRWTAYSGYAAAPRADPQRHVLRARHPAVPCMGHRDEHLRVAQRRLDRCFPSRRRVTPNPLNQPLPVHESAKPSGFAGGC